jgi:hypothetical protein
MSLSFNTPLCSASGGPGFVDGGPPTFSFQGETLARAIVLGSNLHHKGAAYGSPDSLRSSVSVSAAEQLEGEALGDPLVVADLQDRLLAPAMSKHPGQLMPADLSNLPNYTAWPFLPACAIQPQIWLSLLVPLLFAESL